MQLLVQVCTSRRRSLHDTAFYQSLHPAFNAFNSQRNTCSFFFLSFDDFFFALWKSSNDKKNIISFVCVYVSLASCSICAAPGALCDVSKEIHFRSDRNEKRERRRKYCYIQKSDDGLTIGYFDRNYSVQRAKKKPLNIESTATNAWHAREKKRVRPERQEKEISRDWTNSTVDKCASESRERERAKKNYDKINHKLNIRANERSGKKIKSRISASRKKIWKLKQKKKTTAATTAIAHKCWMEEKVRVIHTTAFGCNLICILRTLNEIVYAFLVSTKTRNDGRINVTA